MDKQIRDKIYELRQELKNCKITKSPLLKRMKKDNWTVDVNNKGLISWAGIHTLELLEEKFRREK